MAHRLHAAAAPEPEAPAAPHDGAEPERAREGEQEERFAERPPQRARPLEPERQGRARDPQEQHGGENRRPVLQAELEECTLATTAGDRAADGHRRRPVRLDRYLGKPAVLFYVDRGSTEMNQAVKDALSARARRDGLLDAASVIAVANIAAYNFFPARDIATAFIKRAEAKAGIPILLDVDGTLVAPTWDLPGDTSTVLRLDRSGHIVWKHSGKLPPDQTERMLGRLTEMPRESAAQP